MTRRQLLAAVASAPFVPIALASSRIQIIEEPHLLAAESARGYRAVANSSGPPGSGNARWIIVPGIRDLTPQSCASLLKRVSAGAWLLLESGLCYTPRAHASGQLKILKDGFGLNIQPPLDAHSYIRYSWPIQLSVRPFQALTPVRCGSEEVIATHDGLPICMRREVGRGGIVYLGSMLGPGLMAEEREAHQFASALLQR